MQVLGACWYLLSIERQEACWRHVCREEGSSCQSSYFDCRKVKDSSRTDWFKSSNITIYCDPNKNTYPFGIYSDSVTSDVTSAMFFNKYFYCLWWGLKNLRYNNFLNPLFDQNIIYIYISIQSVIFDNNFIKIG